MIGLLGMIGVGVTILIAGRPQLKKYLLVVMIILLVLLAMRTMVRNANWSDAITLYKNDIKIQDDYNKRDGLGVEFIYEGKFEQALTQIQKSVKMNPYYANVNDLGVVYQHMGNREKAKEYYARAIKLNPTLLSPYINYATILVLYDDPKDAVPIIKNQLIKNHPDVSRFWLLLAIAEYKLHDEDSALESAQGAYSLSIDMQTQYVLSFITKKRPINELNVALLE